MTQDFKFGKTGSDGDFHTDKLTQDLEKKFDEKFRDESCFCSCGEGDLHNAWPEARKELLAFISSEIQKAYDEGYKDGYADMKSPF